jgi:hypothetical protein
MTKQITPLNKPHRCPVCGKKFFSPTLPDIKEITCGSCMFKDVPEPEATDINEEEANNFRSWKE